MSIGRLRFAEDGLQVRWRSAGDQSGFIEDNKIPPRELGTPLEASHDHLLVTPPSHFTPQKAKGWVDRLNKGCEGTIVKRILLTSEIVKGKIAFKNTPDFQAQTDDLRLKCCILGENPQNSITGRNIAWKGIKNPLKMAGRVQNTAGRYPKDRRFLLAIQDVTSLHLA